MGRRLDDSIRDEMLAGPPSMQAVLKVAYARLFAPRRWSRLTCLWRPWRLTGRQMEVLLLMAQGYTNAEIARTLAISYGTVKQHAGDLFRRLHVTCRERAIVKAIALAAPLLGDESQDDAEIHEP